MMQVEKIYDVAIIGSGIAGSALAAILARNGRSVIVFEGGEHPRFSIGESMILETSETMRALAEFFDVPELAYYSSENYFEHIGTSHGVKRHFMFLQHAEGQPHALDHTLQAVIPKEPHGHELHLYRQDSDYFMMSTAIRYGAEVCQNTRVSDVDVTADGVVVSTQKGDQVAARYIVDAGGFRSVLSDKFDLRRRDLQTHSRAIFTHMIGIPDFHEIGRSQADYGLPFAISEGTVHHVFEGGWLWVIPFNNHARATNPLCSVGLMLDPRIHPERSDLSAEEEFFDFIRRFPQIEAHLRQGKAVRKWVRAGRIQYASKQVVGDRWALLGHAAGFVDPLFSKGLYVSLTCVSVLSDLLLTGLEADDLSAARFAPLERVTQAFGEMNDRLIANAYKSFADPRLWQAYSVLWLLGAYTELVKLTSLRAQAVNGRISRADYFRQIQGLHLAGGGFVEFRRVANQIDGLMEALDLSDGTAVATTAARIKAILEGVEWIPKPFHDVLNGKTYLPRNKLRLGLLKQNHGFLGHGEYRRHFFGETSTLDMLRAYLRERSRYSVTHLRQEHKKMQTYPLMSLKSSG